MSGCSSDESGESFFKLEKFLFMSMFVLPLGMMSVYGLICFARDKNNGTLFERWMRMLGDWVLNGILVSLSWAIFFLVIMNWILFGIFFFCLLLRIFYVNKLENQEKTWKHWVIFIIWSLYFVGFLLFMIFGTMFFFVLLG